MYDVSDQLPVATIGPGTNLLVTGPQGAGKYDLLCDVLAAGIDRGQRAVAVTTGASASVVRGDVAASVSGESALAVVDCVSRERGGSTSPDPDVEYVDSPAALGEIGTATSEFVAVADERGVAIRLGFDSLSTLLRSADEKTVFRFLHILTGRVSGVDGLGVATLDDGHDRRTVNTLRQLFDGVVETRQGLESRECRVVGVGDGPTDWTAF